MTTTIFPAPNYIPADDYKGRTAVYNVNSDVFTAKELAEFIGAGNTAPLFVYYGHLRNGKKLFARDRFYSDGEKLYGYDSTGQLMIIHPAERKIRIHTK